jgi:hypothetical protein
VSTYGGLFLTAFVKANIPELSCYDIYEETSTISKSPRLPFSSLSSSSSLASTNTFGVCLVEVEHLLFVIFGYRILLQAMTMLRLIPWNTKATLCSSSKSSSSSSSSTSLFHDHQSYDHQNPIYDVEAEVALAPYDKKHALQDACDIVIQVWLMCMHTCAPAWTRTCSRAMHRRQYMVFVCTWYSSHQSQPHVTLETRVCTDHASDTKRKIRKEPMMMIQISLYDA